VSASRVSATRRIAAPAGRLFEIVSSPAGHVRIDGSGMLEATPDAGPVAAVGDSFDMDMDRTPLSDIPGLVKYKVRNTVTQFVPDRLIEWTVGSADRPPLGHVYGWQIEPVSDTESDVTNYCDWTGIPQEARARRPWPVVPVHMLEQSVENLERIATQD
jgi:uncharacterized protein YndB with AHSA1/START domain